MGRRHGHGRQGGLRLRAARGEQGQYLHNIHSVPVATQVSRDTDTGDLAGEARLEDVALGEVWVCSGQSNMAWWVENTGKHKWHLIYGSDTS